MCYQMTGMHGKKILKKFPKYCNLLIYKHAKKPIGGPLTEDEQSLCKGGISKLTDKDKSLVGRTLKKLKKNCVAFTSKHVQLGLANMSNRTVR